MGYDVQYEITYLHDSWTKTETVTLKSKGVVTVFGDEKTDTNRNNYLNIELKQLVDGDEGAEWEEAGSIKVYPNGNIYWSILHGPEVRLEQQH